MKADDMKPCPECGVSYCQYTQESEGEGALFAAVSRRDWPAAKAALDALIESEQEEWVEWTTPHGGPRLRASRDGSRVQMMSSALGPVQDWCDESDWIIGNTYRKGREVALEESAKSRDCAYRAGLKARDWQVQELVEAMRTALKELGE